MMARNLVMVMLFLTVISPIVLYTDKLAASFKSSSSTNEFIEDVAAFSLGVDARPLNLIPQESSLNIEEPVGIVHSDNATESSTNSDTQDLLLLDARDHLSSRVLSATTEEDQSQNEDPIRMVTDGIHEGNQSSILHELGTTSANELGTTSANESTVKARDAGDNGGKQSEPDWLSNNGPEDKERKRDGEHAQTSNKVYKKKPSNTKTETQNDQTAMHDAVVRHLKDLLIRAKVYSSFDATKNQETFITELSTRVKDVKKALWNATKDSELPKDVSKILKAMEQTLDKGKQIQDDCSTIVKKLRAILHRAEDQLQMNKKQNMFLTQLTAKTLPKGLHCLPLRLTIEYHALNTSQQHFPNQEKLENPQLYHYALFSDNVLAAAVVVNSTITNAKDSSKHVFHIVTDKLNYAAMRMWFLVNRPGDATIQVQNIEEFTWLNSSYSPVLKQLGSPSMIDYYFKAHQTKTDSNLKFRNPKYLSILNHLRFYLPEIFPKLNKVLFLDDDIVVQKDLTALWSLNLKGNVNGAVETCGESFHRFDRYLNFSNPLIAINFDPRACGWAYGMNIFDLEEWKRQKITEVYHTWQRLNHDRQLWKLGTLPPGLITFWKRTYPLDRSWHVLGLGYNPNVNEKEIKRAAVIHYNGNLKPWLETGIVKYRNYWAKYVDYDHQYLRECNLSS